MKDRHLITKSLKFPAEQKLLFVVNLKNTIENILLVF